MYNIKAKITDKLNNDRVTIFTLVKSNGTKYNSVIFKWIKEDGDESGMAGWTVAQAKKAMRDWYSIKNIYTVQFMVNGEIL